MDSPSSARNAPREIQEEAARRGFIPYLPPSRDAEPEPLTVEEQEW